jgi:hypothetical protein
MRRSAPRLNDYLQPLPAEAVATGHAHNDAVGEPLFGKLRLDGLDAVPAK